MDLVAQSVRASDCGSEGRGFDPHPSPTTNKKEMLLTQHLFFLFIQSRIGMPFSTKYRFKSKIPISLK